MKRIKVNIEWASDGTVGAMMEEDLFAGMGDTVEEAVEDMRKGVAFFIETAKEKGFPYKPYLDAPYEVELSYDVASMLAYAKNYMTDARLSKLTGINSTQIGRYAAGKSKPRPAQQRKIVEALSRFATSFVVTL